MSQNSRNQGFSYYICLMIEGSGSIPLTNGSGSRRPKNRWIWWIRIRNTALKGVWHEILDFRFFSWISVPQAPKYSIGAVLNFFENSQRYSLTLAINCSAVSTTPAKNLSPVSLTPAINPCHGEITKKPINFRRCQWHRWKTVHRCQQHRR